MHDKAHISAKTPEATKPNTVQTRKSEFNSPVTSPIDYILSLQQTIGNQAVQRLIRNTPIPGTSIVGQIQSKLKIGQPNDVYEKEADRIADQVMRMPGPAVQLKPG